MTNLEQTIEGHRSEPGYTFSHHAGDLSVDFVNTVSTAGLYQDMRYEQNPRYSGDHIGNYFDVLEWGRQLQLLTDEEAERLLAKAEQDPEAANEAVTAFKRLRHAIYRIFTGHARGLPVSDDALAALNEELPHAMSHAQLVKTQDGFGWGWDAKSDALTRMLWPVAKAAVDLLTNDESRLERVHQCASNECGWLFIDMSRNHSRRWCDMKDCGNVAKARRHYQRKKVQQIGA